MECDVIPDCSQEVDPLGNLANCDSLSAPDEAHVFALDAQIVSSTDITYHVQSLPATTPSRPPPHPSLHVRSAAPSSNPVSKPASGSNSQQSSSTVTPARRKPTKTPSNSTAKKNVSRSTTSKIRQPSNESSAPSTQPSSSVTQASTMREVLASIPGFSIKPRRRTSKKMSTAAQIAQTREGCIDLETPDSILVGANLRSLLNKHTFLMLPPLFQYKLVQLLPGVDRPPIDPDPNAGIRLNASSLNNEFFARACLEWRDRLSEGEFTPENQMKLRADAEKEKSRLDPWKLKHFEPIWGRDKNQSVNVQLNATTGEFEHSAAASHEGLSSSTNTSTTPSYTTSSGRTVRHPSTFSNSVPSAPKRSPRTVGAMTRASAAAVVYQSPNLTSNDSEVTVPPTELRTVLSKTPRVLDMNVPEELNASANEVVLPTFIQDDIDTIIIPDDDPITTSSGMTVTITSSSSVTTPKSLLPTTYTIPAGIELIPLDSSQSSTTMVKRAQKRSNSSDRNQIKISKFNENTRSPSQPAHHHHHHHHHHQHHHNHHKRSPIPSKPSPPDNTNHNGSCAVSDVIQIIKLPKDASAQHKQHLHRHHQQNSNDKQSADNKSWTTLLDSSMPSMSVAVTTIASPTIAQNDKYQQHIPPATAAANAPRIEIIKRSSKHETQPSSPSRFVTPFASKGLSSESPAAQIPKRNFDLPLPGATEHHHLDTELDVDETSFSESAADHVFRAMVCHGDDVLCGDGSLTTVHPPEHEVQSNSAVLYSQAYNAQQSTTTITLDDSPPPPTTDHSDTLSDTTVVIISDDPSMDVSVEAHDQCDGVPHPNNDKDDRLAESTAVNNDNIDRETVEAAVEELEPSIQSLVELDPIEQEFNDAENYVLESGEISADSGVRDRAPLDTAASPLHTPTHVVAQSIGETQPQQQQQQQQQSQANHTIQHQAIHAVPETEVIPMQETLELRLKESTYPSAAAANWSYKMEGRMMAAKHADNSNDVYVDGTEATNDGNSEDDSSHQQQHQRSYSANASSMVLLSQPANSYATTSQVKLELEVTLTPEAEVSSSTLASSHSSNSGGPSFCDSDQSNEEQRVFRSASSMAPNVIPPTTIVCLPSPMSSTGETHPMQTYITSSNFDAISKGNTAAQSTVVFTNNHIQRPPVSLSLPPVSTQPNLTHQSTIAASSSSLPYLSLASTQPLRAVPQHQSMGGNRPKVPSVSKSGRGSRGNSNRPPPGAVNLERSYQICQAVIQSSPNRHQLKAQLRPPPSMLSTGVSSASSAHPSPPPLPGLQSGTVGNITQVATLNKKDDGNAGTKQTIQHIQPQPQRVAFAKKPAFIQRQPSPVLVRHVFTTSQGIPVSMAVLPAGMHPAQVVTHQSQPPIQYRMSSGATNGNVMSADMVASGGNNQSGQYILVQRTPGLISADIPAPRSSSAPPAQQHQQPRSGQVPPIGVRGRPASVDIDGILIDGSDESPSPEGGSPEYGDMSDNNLHLVQTQIPQQPQQHHHNQQQHQLLLQQQQHGNLKLANNSSSSMNSGFSYAPELIGVDGAQYAQPHHFVAVGENTPPNCSCSMNAMVICQQCGIFCHDQCMGSAKLCLSCVIR